MRVVGVDFGATRIGIAVGESEGAVTTARLPLTASGALKKDAQAISALVRSEEAEAVVVGIPVREEDSRMTRICEQLAGRLEELGLRVYKVNEAMTTLEADSHLMSAGLKASARRKLRDGEAARLILERFFHEAH